MSDISFPRMHARSQRFTLGRPRSFTVTDDRLLFLRSAAGDDRVHDLWVLDLASGDERRVTDARSLQDGDDELTAEERARRERLREGGSGIVAYSADESGRSAVFTLGGQVWVVDTDTGAASELRTSAPAFDPRLSADGHRVAAVVDGDLHVGEVATGSLKPLVAEDGVTWGLAEFVAAEEMERTRGFWWGPDGDRLLVARVDERDVDVWHIGNPADPSRQPVVHRYPAAGTTNADVSLWLVDPSCSTPTGARTPSASCTPPVPT
jgi:dipeptidyl-peptidase 4